MGGRRLVKRAACAALCGSLALALPALAGDEDPWFADGRAAIAQRLTYREPAGPARNLVLFVGDGMGFSTVTAARIFQGQQRGAPGEEGSLRFESFPVTGLVKVYNTDQQVPDSAGTMTAIVTGVKTKAGVLGVDDRVIPSDYTSVPGSRVPTLLEQAEDRGMATGIVTTTRVTHATPAACYAHSPNREWESDATLSDAARKADFPDLARQLVDFPHGDGIDVVLGGGRSAFLGANQPDPETPGVTGTRWDERDLAQEWRAAAPGRAVAWTSDDLHALTGPGVRQVLGLFEPGHMKFESDRATDEGGEPSLARMTEFAIRHLSRTDEGFVLVVEAGRIDHAHHANNAYRALVETVELSRAVERALSLVDPAETLVLVTADHGHPLTMGGYATRGNPILGLVHANALGTGRPLETPAKDGLGRPYATLRYALGPGHHAPTDAQPEGTKHFPHEPERFEEPGAGRPDLSGTDLSDPDLLQQAGVPRFAGAHSGEDVGIWAQGPGARLFSGSLEQNAIYHGMVEALGWNAPPEGDAATTDGGAGPPGDTDEATDDPGAR